MLSTTKLATAIWARLWVTAPKKADTYHTERFREQAEDCAHEQRANQTASAKLK